MAEWWGLIRIAIRWGGDRWKSGDRDKVHRGRRRMVGKMEGRAEYLKHPLQLLLGLQSGDLDMALC